MKEDRQTQRHAVILARNYNLSPYDKLKTERAMTPETDISSCWLATKTRHARCFVQYHQDQLVASKHNISGTIIPDSTGDYDVLGHYEDRPWSKHQTENFYIWWDGIDSWIISTVLGTTGDDYHKRTDINVNSIYSPEGIATGDAIIAEGYGP